MSIAMRLAHRPGALLTSLESFARHQVNLLKIESRPIHGRPWEDQFFLDVESERLALPGTGPRRSAQSHGRASRSRSLFKWSHITQGTLQTRGRQAARNGTDTAMGTQFKARSVRFNRSITNCLSVRFEPICRIRRSYYLWRGFLVY